MTVTVSYRVVGRYLMCEPFASGGMASVHLGRLLGGEGFTRTVAIKQLYAHFARDQEFVRMFLDEARLLSRIRHPHVVAPLDVSRVNAELFIIMEYVHGAALSRMLEKQPGPVSLPIATGVVQQALLGLHAAHEATDEAGAPLELVHRDVSPQNILVDGHGSVRVVDFGIAKAVSRAQTTQEGRLKGKPGYLAPEQLRFEAVDRRTDIFNTGIVLWELLSGERLFSADGPVGALERIQRGDLPPPSRNNPDVPPELDAVVAQALRSDPAGRFATAREMAVALMAASPAATPLEIGAWVETSIGPELRAREQAIAALELISPHDLTQVLEQPGRPAAAEEKPARATRTPDPVGGVLVEAPSAPPQSQSSGLGAKLAALPAQHPSSLVLSAVVTIVLLFAYDAVFRQAPQGAQPDATAPSRAAFASRPTPVPSAAAEPRPLVPKIVTAPSLAEPAAATLPAALQPATTPSTAIEPATTPATATPAAAVQLPATPSAVAPTSTTPTAATPNAATPTATMRRPLAPKATMVPPSRQEVSAPPAADSRRPCREDELYTIDAQGVKRWKKDRPECYTWSGNSRGR